MAQDGIEIAHQHHRRPALRLAQGAHQASVRFKVCPPASARALACCRIGPSATGSLNGMPSSITSAPAAGRPQQRQRRIGVARREIGGQAAGPARRSAPRVWSPVRRAASSYWVTVSRSCRRARSGNTIRMSSGRMRARVRAHEPAHGRFSAGRMPAGGSASGRRTRPARRSRRHSPRACGRAAAHVPAPRPGSPGPPRSNAR